MPNSRSTRQLFTIGAMVLVLVAGLAIWTYGFGKRLTDSTTVAILLAALAYTALTLWLNLPKATFLGLGRITSAELPVLVEHIVRVGAVVFVSLWFAVVATGRKGPLSSRVAPLFERLPDLAPGPEVAGLLLAAAHVLAMLVAVVAAYMLFARARIPAGRASPEVRREYIRLGLPVAMYLAVAVWATQMDRVMVGYFWDASDVGEYFAAQRLVLLVLALPNAIFTTIFPRISYHLSLKELEATKGLMVKAERYMSMLLFLVLALVVTFAEQALNLIFGRSFIAAAPILRVLALMVLFTGLARPYHALATGAGKPRFLFEAGVLMAVLNVGLNLVLIPRSILGVELFGLRAFGAGIASAVATFAAFVYFRVRAQPLMPLPYVMPFHVKHAVAGLAVWAVITVPELLVPGDLYAPVGDFFPLAWLVAGNVLGVLVYLVVLALLREVTREEARLVRDLLHPVGMLRDMRADLKATHEERR